MSTKGSCTRNCLSSITVTYGWAHTQRESLSVNFDRLIPWVFDSTGCCDCCGGKKKRAQRPSIDAFTHALINSSTKVKSYRENFGNGAKGTLKTKFKFYPLCDIQVCLVITVFFIKLLLFLKRAQIIISFNCSTTNLEQSSWTNSTVRNHRWLQGGFENTPVPLIIVCQICLTWKKKKNNNCFNLHICMYHKWLVLSVYIGLRCTSKEICLVLLLRNV